MPVEIDVTLKGNEDAIRKLTKIKTSLQQNKTLFDRETIQLQRIFTKRFESQGEGKWSPLSPATVFLSQPHKPLNDTGMLKGSLGGKNSDSIRKYSRESMTFGTQHKAAAVHNEGKDIAVTTKMRGWFALNEIFLTKEKAKISIPKRAFFYLTTGDERQISLVWNQWADEIVRRYAQ